MTIYPPGAIFCKTCGYCLHGLPQNRCPECGHDFDPADSKTFRLSPRRVWPRRVLVWGGIPLLLLFLAYGGLLTWLYVGWKAEAGARGAATGQYDQIETRSILPPALSWVLVGDFSQWQERLDTLVVKEHPLSSEQIHAIAARRHLRVLCLWSVRLKQDDVALLCQCRELEELDLWSAGLHSEDLAPISGLVRLKVLSLNYNEEVDDAALPVIAKLKELQDLDLADTAITDGGLAHLAGLPNLEDLRLHQCPQLTDAAVPHLSRLTGLKKLFLDYTSLTPEGVRRLRAALPQCKIEGP